MKALAASLSQGEMSLHPAEVKMRSGEDYIVLREHVLTRACRAAGCLLEPEAGDVVLTASASAGPVFILSVLSRTRPEADACLSTPGASMVLGPEVLKIRAGKEISVAAPSVSLAARTGQAYIDACMLRGEFLEIRFTKIRTVAKAVETLCERLVEELERSYRRVRDFEERRMGRLRTVVEGIFSLTAKNASIRAEKRLKMDGEKIHLG